MTQGAMRLVSKPGVMKVKSFGMMTKGAEIQEVHGSHSTQQIFHDRSSCFQVCHLGISLPSFLFLLSLNSEFKGKGETLFDVPIVNKIKT